MSYSCQVTAAGLAQQTLFSLYRPGGPCYHTTKNSPTATTDLVRGASFYERHARSIIGQIGAHSTPPHTRSSSRVALK